MDDDFVFVDEVVSGVRWDAKYATWDNFTGKPVNGYLANRIVGTRALCAALDKVRKQAESLGFGLLLWDGYRPRRAVDCFLGWSERPEDGRTKARHYPNIDRAEMFKKGSRRGNTHGGRDEKPSEPPLHHGGLRLQPLQQRVVALHADRRALPGHLL